MHSGLNGFLTTRQGNILMIIYFQFNYVTTIFALNNYVWHDAILSYINCQSKCLHGCHWFYFLLVVYECICLNVVKCYHTCNWKLIDCVLKMLALENCLFIKRLKMNSSVPYSFQFSYYMLHWMCLLMGIIMRKVEQFVDNNHM